MAYLSTISFTAAICYFTVGIYAIISNKKSKLCRCFFYLTLCLAIWSFGAGFGFLAGNVYEYSFWNKFSAFGWCTFQAVILYFTVVLTRYKRAERWYIRLLIVLPSLILLSMVLFLFGPDKNPGPSVEKAFYIGDALYSYFYPMLSIIIIFLWGRKSQNRTQRKQAQIIVVSSIIPLFLEVLFQMVLPLFNIITLPNMGHIFALIMLFGVDYTIVRYQFMSIPSSLITYELFNDLNGVNLLTDTHGIIMKANRQAGKLLECDKDEIIGKHINSIIEQKDINDLMKHSEAIQKKIKFQDVKLLLKSGKTIPFNISVIPLHTKNNLLRGLLLIGEDIRANKRLKDEIAEHKKTNTKLQNNEMMLRMILEISPIAIVLISRISNLVIYLNTTAEELFGIKKEEVIGKNSENYFYDHQGKDTVLSNYESNQDVKQSEIQFKRTDGSRFIGLMTVIDSIFHEEEVALCYVVDVTDQKRVEETLKINNEYIIKLNKELMIMNKNLANKSIRDSLTNLYNHQYINEVLENILLEMPEKDENLCLMMLDIDYFKLVNDQFGHQSGDNVLTIISDLLEQNTRSNDYIGRYGGEEFIVVLPDTDIDEAYQIAENIRQSIDDYDFGLDNFKISISTGVVQYAGEKADELINRADKLLYQAKSNGRNRVEK